MIAKYTEKPLGILAKRWPNQASDQDLIEYVRSIVEEVKSRGDDAVKENTSKFDKVDLVSFRVTKEEIQEAYKLVSQEQVEALREARKRLEIVESLRLSQMNYETTIDGVNITCTTRPLEKVGCYVPGGKAAYPSSLIMNVTPAKVAGVPRIIVCTPPV